MHAVTSPNHAAGAWQAYAASGRPDFLNYLRRGDVTWSQLWAYYRDTPADPEAIRRLMGLFHIFLSQDFEREGSVLLEGDDLHRQLLEWADFVVAYPALVPESAVRDCLSRLLSQSLITGLYYEAVFGVYVQAVLRRHAESWSTGQFYAEERSGQEPAAGERRLSLQLPNLPRCPDAAAARSWESNVNAVISNQYERWNSAFALAIGDEDDSWQDEGSGG